MCTGSCVIEYDARHLCQDRSLTGAPFAGGCQRVWAEPAMVLPIPAILLAAVSATQRGQVYPGTSCRRGARCICWIGGWICRGTSRSDQAPVQGLCNH